MQVRDDRWKFRCISRSDQKQGRCCGWWRSTQLPFPVEVLLAFIGFSIKHLFGFIAGVRTIICWLSWSFWRGFIRLFILGWTCCKSTSSGLSASLLPTLFRCSSARPTPPSLPLRRCCRRFSETIGMLFFCFFLCRGIAFIWWLCGRRKWRWCCRWMTTSMNRELRNISRWGRRRCRVRGELWPCLQYLLFLVFGGTAWRCWNI